MMARSTTCSNQRPDTLMQDGTSANSKKSSCNARPDHTFGSFASDMIVSIQWGMSASPCRLNRSTQHRRGFKSQGLAWPLIELAGYFVEMGLRVHRQVGSFRKILSQQTIGVLVGTALPWTLRIAKVNIDVGR